jgi:hypothetical protein
MRRCRTYGFLIFVLFLVSLSGPGVEAQWRGRNQTRDGVCFYTEADYRGDMVCAQMGESVRNIGERFNDRISSIRIFGRGEVTVYEDENFQGASQTLRRDVPNLGGWNDRITSFEVGGGRAGTFRPPVQRPEMRNTVCFYEDEDYRGESFCMNPGESRRNVGDQFNDRISSIRVSGRAQVTVYEDDGFRGRSRTFSRDVSNLGDFNDRVSSIRIR